MACVDQEQKYRELSSVYPGITNYSKFTVRMSFCSHMHDINIAVNGPCRSNGPERVAHDSRAPMFVFVLQLLPVYVLRLSKAAESVRTRDESTPYSWRADSRSSDGSCSRGAKGYL